MSNPIVDGVVVLYRPTQGVIESIRSYVHALRRLYVIDNSPTPLERAWLEEIEALGCVQYHFNHANHGIAYALNQGIALAYDAQWLLCMDQDSFFAPDGIEKLLTYEADASIALIAPWQITHQRSHLAFTQTQEVESVMTSGTLLRLSVCAQVGGFEERYFIDYVDHEYALRLRRAGYKVMLVHESYLDHTLGSVRECPWLHTSTTCHSPSRRYTITRNRIDLWRTYRRDFGAFVRRDQRLFVYELIKILLCEQEKWGKMVAIYHGIMDAMRGRWGVPK